VDREFVGKQSKKTRVLRDPMERKHSKKNRGQWITGGEGNARKMGWLA